jgi:large subunit ribosomal protein L9
MMMQLILVKDVEALGRAGEIVDVKPGFARNYLLPQGFAYRATPANMRRLENERRKIEEAAERTLETASVLGGKLEGVAVNFKARAGEEGKLFGSVTTADIAEKLAEQGIEIDRHLIRLEEPIKQLGVYKVPVRLHAEVKPEITVWVVADE